MWRQSCVISAYPAKKKKGTQIDTVFARYTGSMIYGFHLANTKSFSQVTASSPTVCEG